MQYPYMALPIYAILLYIDEHDYLYILKGEGSR